VKKLTGLAVILVLFGISSCAQYRGFVYKIPDFEMTSLKVDKYTHSAVPLRRPGGHFLAWSCFPPIFKAAGRAALIVSRLATVALMLALPVV
jgi:hypothetical protein